MAKVYNYKSKIKRTSPEYGQSIEQKMRVVTETGEKITDAAPIIYTEHKDGVLPQYDIRTDRFDVALEAMDKVNRSNIAKRDEFLRQQEEQNNQEEKNE